MPEANAEDNHGIGGGGMAGDLGPLRFAVLGLGEAGGAIAADLAAAGAVVTGFDPAANRGVPGAVRQAATVAAAAAAADIVLSVNAASVAVQVATEAMPSLRQGGVWADLNTAAPALKRRLAALAERHGLLFADVALMAPVPGRGLATPALAAGTGARRYAKAIGPLGGQVRLLDGPAGDAAARKLLRSVYMKGLAAAVLEALAAARAAGCEEWLREDLARQFGAEQVERLERGSHRHAARRVDEMAAAGALLEELGVPPRVANAARAWLAELAGLAVPGGS
jgi:3-hydroxyisobutyrate dehydrogenase-like beta-hydroxyacid dehydrogenase